jgi:hypothetical protein
MSSSLSQFDPRSQTLELLQACNSSINVDVLAMTSNGNIDELCVLPLGNKPNNSELPRLQAQAAR